MTQLNQTKKPCDHYWFYPHAIIQGPTRTSTVIVRKCSHCKRKEMAVVTGGMWKQATGDYKREEHYDGL